jgi:hypothetical protein
VDRVKFKQRTPLNTHPADSEEEPCIIKQSFSSCIFSLEVFLSCPIFTKKKSDFFKKIKDGKKKERKINKTLVLCRKEKFSH